MSRFTLLPKNRPSLRRPAMAASLAAYTGLTMLTPHAHACGFAVFQDSALRAAALETPSLVVTSLGDTVADDGVTTLREAVTRAASQAGADTITFDPALNGGTIALTSQILINSPLTIQGPGAGLLTVTTNDPGNAAFRNFEVAKDQTVTISGLTIAGGKSTVQNPYGGAVWVNRTYSNDATVKVRDCVLQGNLAANGAALYNVDEVTRCTFKGNTAEHVGGAFYTLTTATIRDCTFENNAADGWGGAAYALGTLKVINSTFVGNQAKSDGGAIQASGGQLVFCTITGNKADSDGNSSGSGGGVFRPASPSGSFSITNSIIAGNTAFEANDASGNFGASDYNLVGSGSGFTSTGTHNQIGVSAGLAPDGLKDNGGPTRTIALLPASPAINAGTAYPLADGEFDQRGTGFLRTQSSAPDLGAFELELNKAPVARDLIVVVKPEATSIRFTLPASDPEGHALTYRIVDAPSWGTASVNGQTATYALGSGFAGQDQFAFRVNDGENDSNLATVTVKYNGAPDIVSIVPAKADGSVSGSGKASTSGEPLKLALTVSDEDGADNIRAAYLTFNKSLTNSSGIALSYDRTTNRLYLRSSDGKTTLGGVAPGTAGTVENDFAVLDFGASTVVKSGSELTVTFAVTPKAAFEGVKKLWAQVKDIGNVQVGFFEKATWTVLPPAPPVSHVEALSTVEVLEPGETSRSITLRANNPDNMLLTYSIVTPPAHGTLGIVNGSRVVYTPSGDFPGSDTFTFKANDGYTDSNLATVTVKYNGAPLLVSLTPSKLNSDTGGSSLVGEPLKLTLEVSDEDGADKLKTVVVNFNKSLTNSNGIMLSYDRGANKLYLRSSDGKSNLGGVAPGTPGTVANDFGVLDFGASTVTRSGNSLTVSFVVTPKASFTGAKKLWGQVKDGSNVVVGFNQMATWTVNPAASATAVRPAPTAPSAAGS